MKQLIIPLCLLLTGCEKALIPGQNDPNGNVLISVVSMETIESANGVSSAKEGANEVSGTSTTSRATVTQMASWLQVCIYDAAGTRIRQVSQERTDGGGFGTVSMSLNDGTYTLMALAHNGDGAATTTNAEKVTFKDNKTTDTFVKAQSLTVSGNTSAAVTIDRCVARIRVKPTDSIPNGTERVKFYYTGGSSTLNTLTAYGAVNSRQTEYRGVSTFYDLYTFPHGDDDVVSLTITALDAKDNELSTMSIADVPVKPKYQTTVTMSAFGGGGSSAGNISVTVSDTPWGEIKWKMENDSNGE